MYFCHIFFHTKHLGLRTYSIIFLILRVRPSDLLPYYTFCRLLLHPLYKANTYWLPLGNHMWLLKFFHPQPGLLLFYSQCIGCCKCSLYSLLHLFDCVLHHIHCICTLAFMALVTPGYAFLVLRIDPVRVLWIYLPDHSVAYRDSIIRWRWLTRALIFFYSLYYQLVFFILHQHHF